VVGDAAPRDHIVQLYQDQDFLNRAVCRFAGAALANGEGIILVPTLTHWNAIRPRRLGRRRRSTSPHASLVGAQQQPRGHPQATPADSPARVSRDRPHVCHL